MSLPDDKDIIDKANTFLSTADLSKSSLRTILEHLEAEFGVILQEKRDLIKTCLTSFIEKYNQPESVQKTNVSESNIEQTDKNESEEQHDGEDDDDIFDTLNEVGDYQPPEDNHTTTEDIPPVEGKIKKSGGFTAPVQLSNDLTEFFGGVHIMPRTEVTKRIWDYVKLYDLQNPKDKRQILCDEKLEKLFRRKSINMFKMTKALSSVSTYCTFPIKFISYII